MRTKGIHYSPLYKVLCKAASDWPVGLPASPASCLGLSELKSNTLEVYCLRFVCCVFSFLHWQNFAIEIEGGKQSKRKRNSDEWVLFWLWLHVSLKINLKVQLWWLTDKLIILACLVDILFSCLGKLFVSSSLALYVMAGAVQQSLL